jgi:hypothetical protein
MSRTGSAPFQKPDVQKINYLVLGSELGTYIPSYVSVCMKRLAETVN